MNVFWGTLLFLTCSLMSNGQEENLEVNSTVAFDKENKTFKIELFPPDPIYTGQTRTPRKLFHKLHSGAAFLTGLKLGTILSKKGFELGHGKIASTHSFQVFGKTVNSAMSLSYGNGVSLLPLVDDEGDVGGGLKRTGLKKDDKKVYHLTVVENQLSENQCDEKEKKEENFEFKGDEIEDELKRESTNSSSEIILFQDTLTEPTDLVKEHNQRVKDFNNYLRRTNSKY